VDNCHQNYEQVLLGKALEEHHLTIYLYIYGEQKMVQFQVQQLLQQMILDLDCDI